MTVHVYLFVILAIYLFVFLPVCLTVLFPASPSLSLSLFTCLYIYPCLRFSFSLSLSLSCSGLSTSVINLTRQIPQCIYCLRYLNSSRSPPLYSSLCNLLTSSSAPCLSVLACCSIPGTDKTDSLEFFFPANLKFMRARPILS